MINVFYDQKVDQAIIERVQLEVNDSIRNTFGLTIRNWLTGEDSENYVIRIESENEKWYALIDGNISQKIKIIDSNGALLLLCSNQNNHSLYVIRKCDKSILAHYLKEHDFWDIEPNTNHPNLFYSIRYNGLFLNTIGFDGETFTINNLQSFLWHREDEKEPLIHSIDLKSILQVNTDEIRCEAYSNNKFVECVFSTALLEWLNRSEVESLLA